MTSPQSQAQPALKRWMIPGAVALIFICSFPPLGNPFASGVDASWMLGINYFFAKSIKFGKDILFTYGPLGFLFCPRPLGHNILLAIIVYSLIKTLFIHSLLCLGFVRKGSILSSFTASFVLVFATSLFVDYGHMLIFLVAASLLLHKETGKIRFLSEAIVISDLAILAKSSLGISCALILGSYVILESWRNKNKVLLSGVVFAYTSIFILSWIVLRQDMGGIPAYLHSIFQFAAGNSSAMSVIPDTVDLLLISPFFFFAFIPLCLKKERIFFFYQIFALQFLAFCKYYFSRADVHHIDYLFYLLTFYAAVLIYMRDKGRKLVFCILLPAALFTAYILWLKCGSGIAPEHMYRLQFRIESIIRNTENDLRSSINNLYERTLNYKAFRSQLDSLSQTHLKAYKLEEPYISLISNASIDVYPWETAWIVANHLNWRPRPVISSFLAFTPWLEAQNAHFFRSEKAPEYLLWPRGLGLLEFESIDKRYLLNDEPMTILEIFNRYTCIAVQPDLRLFKNTSKNYWGSAQKILAQKAHWKEWIQVPHQTKYKEKGIIRLRLSYKKTLLGKIQKFALCELPVFIEYKFKNGRIKKHRFVLENAKSGLWISPYVRKMTKPLTGSKTKEIRFSPAQNFYFEPELILEWEFIPAADSQK